MASGMSKNNHFESVRNTLTRYHNEWRHPRLTPLAVSGIYDLRPNEPTTFEVQHRWHQAEKWPNSDFPGIYFVFNKDMLLLYVGQASILGRRLSQWFRGTEQCDQLRGNWRGSPRFVATVRVDRHFEALSLEGFFIDELQPPENTSLKRIAQIVDDAEAEHPPGS